MASRRRSTLRSPRSSAPSPSGSRSRSRRSKRTRAGSSSKDPRSPSPLGLALGLAQVTEPRVLRLEMQIDLGGRAVPVLGELQAHDLIAPVVLVLLPQEHD